LGVARRGVLQIGDRSINAELRACGSRSRGRRWLSGGSRSLGRLHIFHCRRSLRYRRWGRFRSNFHVEQVGDVVVGDRGHHVPEEVESFTLPLDEGISLTHRPEVDAVS